MLLIQLWQVDGYDMPSPIPFSPIWGKVALTFVEKKKSLILNICICEILEVWHFEK